MKRLIGWIAESGRSERVHAMKRLLSLFVLLVVGGSVKATVFSAVAEPNACVQGDWSRMVPATFGVPEPDPNSPYGSILGPVPGEGVSWELPVGPWKRNWGRCCDPEGDGVTVACVGGTSAAEVVLDAERELWAFAAEVVEGLNLWRFEAKDDRGAARIATVVAWGRRNEPPVLE